MFSEEIRQRLAKEYRYAVTKMQQSPEPAKKLYYFSVFSGEAQRTLNREWNRDLVLIFIISQHVHQQIGGAMQSLAVLPLPIEWESVCDNLIQRASELANYFEQRKDDNHREELFQILGRLAEIAYSVTGNGSYLHEKGLFNL